MAEIAFTCPRCLMAVRIRPAMRFCPRCGLADARAAAEETAPLHVPVGNRTYEIRDRLAIGSVCTLYRCNIPTSGGPIRGIFKVARDPVANGLVANEAVILRRLHAADPANRFTPFLPAIEESIGLSGAGGEKPRQANILRLHREIQTPDDLYSLSEVRSHYRDGLDPRHAAWIWRRLLSILGFTHTVDVVHGAVVPSHVLIDPRDHKLLLIDWCCAQYQPAATGEPFRVIGGAYRDWYRRDITLTRPPTPGLDLSFAARTMIELVGGDPIAGTYPPSVDPALQRHFNRCLGGSSILDAWKLLDDFDQLIGALWGKRTFHVLEMPPRR